VMFNDMRTLYLESRARGERPRTAAR